MRLSLPPHGCNRADGGSPAPGQAPQGVGSPDTVVRGSLLHSVTLTEIMGRWALRASGLTGGVERGPQFVRT